VQYTNWLYYDVLLQGLLVLGHTYQIRFTASGCCYGAHFGEILLDGIGQVPTDLYTLVRTASSVNSGSNVDFTVYYSNTNAATVSGVTLEIQVPSCAAYISNSLPDLTCSSSVQTCTSTSGNCLICTASSFAAGYKQLGTVTFQATGTSGQTLFANVCIKATSGDAKAADFLCSPVKPPPVIV